MTRSVRRRIIVIKISVRWAVQCADRVTAEILGSQAYMRLKLEFNSSLIRWLRRAAVVAHCVTCLAGNYALPGTCTHPSFFSLPISRIIYSIWNIFRIVLSVTYKYGKQLVDNDVQATPR